MNVLEIRPRRYDLDWRKPNWVADIYVDGQYLADLAGEVEVPFVIRDAQSRLGFSLSYTGLPLELAYLPSRYLLGDPLSHERSTPTELLSCSACTEMGCWPLRAVIDVSDAVVVWRNFDNPHRPHWSYRDFGPFTFSRSQYEKALERPPELGMGASR